MKKILTQLGLVLGLSVATSLPVLLTSAPASAASLSANCGFGDDFSLTVASGEAISVQAYTGTCSLGTIIIYWAAGTGVTGAPTAGFDPTIRTWKAADPSNSISFTSSSGGGATIHVCESSNNDLVCDVGEDYHKWMITVTAGGGSNNNNNNSSSSSASSPAKLVKVDLDPAGGTCLVDGRSTTAPTQVMAVGYLYLPGPSDCERPGYSLSGWADQSDPSTKLSLPLLSTDGQRRFFVADSLDLVAVWEPASYAVNLGTLANFLCNPGKCDSVLLLWSVEPDLSGEVTVEIDGVVTQCGLEGAVANLSYCWITGLAPGEHSATVTVESGTMTAQSTARSFALS